jgi:RNA polymerase sigma-70 factor (ECF subfamily)
MIIAGPLAAGPIGLAAAAGEAGPPLLVAVEAEPGFDLDAQEIRKAIGAELGRKIVSPTEDERDLLAALRAQALDALARVFDRWHQRVRVLARRLLGDEAAAEDVVQEVFTSLPRAVRRFRGEVGLQAFVLAIAVKRARHHRRAAFRRRRALARLDQQLMVAAAGGSTPERDFYRMQLGERLALALDRLPHAQRVSFVLCEVEGLTAGEAAAIVDVPEPTVRTRLFHARKKLRDLLTPERAE